VHRPAGQAQQSFIMSIDKSGPWWVGSDAADLREYLIDFTADGYVVHEFRSTTCPCGSSVFHLDADDTQGAAQRTCVACGSAHFICDSKEYWDEAEPERCACPCGSESMNVGAGFSLYPDDHEVRWLYLGGRCTECGVLGCYADWKIDYAPSRQLLDQV
jgi:hypothetical protein